MKAVNFMRTSISMNNKNTYRASVLCWAKRLTLTGLVVSLFVCGAQAQTPVALSPVPAQQFLSSTGVPLASGCIYTSITGTSTPLATFTDGTGTAQNTNPVILDGGGFGNLWLSNSAYRFAIWSYGSGAVGANCGNGVLQRTVDNVSAYTVINQAQNIFLLGASSDPGGSAGELAYRTDIPCFRAFSTLWDCIVTLTATQTLTNKTLASPIITAPTVSNGSFTSPTLSTPVLNGTATGTGLQGTGSKLLTAGVISGLLAAPLCTDAGGSATTTSCIPVVGSAIGCTSIGPGSVVNNNAQQTLMTCVIPANALAAGALLSVDVIGIESTASGQTITITASIGGGTPCGSTFSAGVANNQPWNFSGKFAVLTAGAGGTANWSCEIWGPGNGIAGNNGTVGAPTISVNTTIPNTLLITEQMSVANAGNILVGQLLKAVIY